MRWHRGLTTAAATACLAVVPAAGHAGLVDMRLTPAAQSVCVGTIVRIDLVVASDDARPQPFDALDAVISWDPAFLELLGVDDSRAGATFFISDFLPDPDGVNDDLDDGDAIYTAFAPPGQIVAAPPGEAGLIVTTFEFLALDDTPLTEVGLVPTIGVFGSSRVLLAGQAITGLLVGPAGVSEVLSCTGDVNCDGEVDVLDLIAVVLEWGTGGTPADINDSGLVDVQDLVLVILNWGPCP